MEFEDSRNEPSTKDYETAMSNIDLAREETRKKELSKAREYVISQIKPFARQCVLLEPYWDMHPTFQEFCHHVLSSAPANTNRTFIRDVLFDYGIKESYAKSNKETTPLMQKILLIYEQEKRTFEKKPESSRNEISTQEFKSALSSINSAREQELSTAREYVINQIRPFARQCVHEGADLGLSDLNPTFSNFYHYAKDRAYGTEYKTKLNPSFVIEVLNNFKSQEYFAKREKKTTPLMQKILSIYEQEKRAFEIGIQKECKEVLQLITNDKFVIPKNTNNCIMVDYSTKYIFTCNLELYKSIANNYLQQCCPKKYQRLSLKEIGLSGWVLELTQ